MLTRALPRTMGTPNKFEYSGYILDVIIEYIYTRVLVLKFLTYINSKQTTPQERKLGMIAS